MTLAELLVSMAVLAVLVPVAGALLVGAVSSQHRLDDVRESTVAAQQVATSIESGVRNASAVQPPTAPTDAAPGEYLAVRTRAQTSSGPAWMCQAWLFDADTSTLYTKRVLADSAGRAAIMPPPSTPISSWRVLAEGVARRPVDPASTAANTVATERRLFTYDSARSHVTVDFRVVMSARPRDGVVMSTAAVARPQVVVPGSPSCF